MDVKGGITGVVLWLGVLSTAVLGASTAMVDNPIVRLEVDGVIGPAMDDYIERSLQTAALQHAELVVMRLDTPGGLDASMRGIVRNINRSAVPVVTYVAPTGARAASAGTYILYGSHIAAMAPGTHLGAATPVQIGGLPSPDKERKPETAPAAEAEPEKQKIVNDAVAYIRGLAQLHDRNEEWAERAVREAATLTAEEALELGVIDILAASEAALLKQLHGREITLHGHKRALNTQDRDLVTLAPDWRHRLLSVLTNPNVAYILMLVGIYGLILEFSNPGAIFPGTIGAICLLLALYAFQLLPISYAGLGLILLGVALMIGEAFEPSFGVLGLGGIVAFVFGSILLMDTEAPGFGIDLSVIVVFALISALVFIVAVGMAIRARRRPVVSGREELVGAEGMVVDDFEGQGRVLVHSETWRALSATPLKRGQRVRVTALDGLTLKVEPGTEEGGGSDS